MRKAEHMPFQNLQVGDYRLRQLIGSDAFVDIYFAESQDGKQKATIKVIRTDFAASDDQIKAAMQRFMKEARVIAGFEHPNILSLMSLQTLQVDGVALPCIVMPVCQDQTLAQWLQEGKINRLATDEVAYIVHEVAAALQYAHDRGIIHQDVEPSNILVRSNAERPQAPHLLLTNFMLSVSQNVHGSPAYIAPEQWRGQLIAASDQYALAVMAYKLLTDHFPFQGTTNDLMKQQLNGEPPSPSTFNSQLSRDIDFVLLHALAKAPEQRFASISAFDRAFQYAVHERQMVATKQLESSGTTKLQEGLETTRQTEAIAQQEDSALVSPAFASNKTRILPEQQEQGVSQTPSPHPRLSLLTIVLVALAVAVIAGSSLVYYTNIYRPAQLSAQATATALAHITATAQASQAIAAIQDRFDQITAGTPVFNDAMTNAADNKWDKGSNNLGSCIITNKGYQVRTSAKSFSCWARATNFQNFVYQAQLEIGQNDFGGLFFRCNLQSGKGYAVYVAANGIYFLYAFPGGNQRVKQLVDGISVPSLNMQTYQLAVMAQGNTFDLFVNGSYIVSVQDRNAISNAGIIGLGAATLNANPAEIIYTKVQVWSF